MNLFFTIVNVPISIILLDAKSFKCTKWESKKKKMTDYICSQMYWKSSIQYFHSVGFSFTGENWSTFTMAYRKAILLKVNEKASFERCEPVILWLSPSDRNRVKSLKPPLNLLSQAFRVAESFAILLCCFSFSPAHCSPSWLHYNDQPYLCYSISFSNLLCLYLLYLCM